MRDAEFGYRKPSFFKQFITKIILICLTIVLVWTIYAYLHAFRLEWLGRIYSHLLPVTNGLYTLVETWLPADVKFKVRGAITDDLGQRSLFLLLLTGVVELVLFCVFKAISGIYDLASGRNG